MKKVLIIAYQFPPMGGSGVQRTTKFVKYLRSFDWEPIVFTRDIGNMKLRDDSLLQDIPENTKILRTKPYDATELSGLFSIPGKIIGRKLLIPDAERLWQLLNKKRALQAVVEEKPDVIYTTSYPYSDHLMGLSIKKAYPNIPWIVDFRDEWTNNPYLLDNPHYSLRMTMEKKMEAQVLKSANILITNTPIMMENFIKSYPFSKEKFHVIPNGYDEADFTDLPKSQGTRTAFTITYTGALYGRRKPDLFFEAISSLIAEEAIDKNKMHINLIGNFKVEHLQQLISQYNLKNVVHILPYMEHGECLRYLMNSDALLLLEGAGPGSEAFYTGKVFEYMNTARPILAIIPENGAAARLVRDTACGLVSDCSDLQATKNNILMFYDCWLSDNMQFSPRWDVIKTYERKELTHELSKLFQKAIDSKNNA